jgi:chemotaxis protein methyltransferase CheR
MAGKLIMNEPAKSVTNEELADIIDLVRQVHGFDFSDYSKASFKRRVNRVLMIKKLDVFDLKHSIINSQSFFQDFLEEVTVNVTEMFRDPTFFKALCTDVMPYLSTWQHIKIWSAGCSSGEEVYSLAILMNQLGMKNKSFIYGTDVNTVVLKEAKKGIYSLRNVKSYTENYQLSGLSGSLTEHFTTMYDAATIHSELKVNTLFSVHNLISDTVFNEFQLITCRNVFIYFETALQEHVLDLFYKSLAPHGFLCLGSKETIRSDKFKKKFRPVNNKENIYQKIDA